MSTTPSLSAVLKPRDVPPLVQDKFDALPADAIAFLRGQTGHSSDEELKKHVYAVQAKAYQLFPYGTIEKLSFLRLIVTMMPVYQQILKLGKEREGAIFLDVGACFGVETRKVVADGFPADQVVATDIEKGFWELGHELFGTTPETCPINFTSGSVLDSSFIPTSGPISTLPQGGSPQLKNLPNLLSLQGHVSAIYIAAIFHLFQEEEQAQLAHNLSSLLSPQPGSVITGWHMGSKNKGDTVPGYEHVFAHSPESWTELWTGIFGEGKVKVDAKLFPAPGAADPGLLLLGWAIVRL